MPLCYNHTWTQIATVSETNETSVIKRYTHQCPQCGHIKITERAFAKRPASARWLRELEKLILRARKDGCVFQYNESPLRFDAVTCITGIIG